MCVYRCVCVCQCNDGGEKWMRTCAGPVVADVGIESESKVGGAIECGNRLTGCIGSGGVLRRGGGGDYAPTYVSKSQDGAGFSTLKAPASRLLQTKYSFFSLNLQNWHRSPVFATCASRYLMCFRIDAAGVDPMPAPTSTAYSKSNTYHGACARCHGFGAVC